MFYWSSFPFVRLIIPFVLGIIAFYYLNIEPHLIEVVVTILLIFSVFLLLHRFSKSFSLRWLSGVCVYLLLFSLGLIYTYQFKNKSLPPSLDPHEKVTWLGKVEEVIKKDENIRQILVYVTRVKTGNNWQDTNFKLLVNNRDSALKVSINDWVTAEGKLYEPKEPLNPSQFNYKDFLHKKSVYLITSEDNMQIFEGVASISRYASTAREKLIDVYRSVGVEGDELAVLVALTLGDKSKLNFKLKKEYAGVGAMHILAVSGLHVGIVFLIFSSLLKPLPNKKIFNYLKGIILLSVIWLFALLAGFSPSVQRASWMFSFVIVSNALQKNANVINSIAASAFLLLLINPDTIFQLGFWLSYSAVIGIVLVYPMVYPLFTSKYTIVNKAWGLIVVSLAAQLATLPFAIYYFHQFPNYFLLTNLFVIPLAFCVVTGAIAITTIKLVVGVDLYLGEILNKILQTLNYGIERISLIPYAITENIWIEPISFYCLFLIIAFGIYFLYSNKKLYLMISMSLLVLVFSYESFVKLEQLNTKQLTFYATNSNIISYVNGLTAKVYYAESMTEFDRKLTKDHLHSLGVDEVSWEEVESNKENEVIRIHDKLLVFNPKMNFLELYSEYLDFVVLTKSSGYKRYKSFGNYPLPVIANNFPYQLQSKNNKVYFLKLRGAYCVKL